MVTNLRGIMGLKDRKERELKRREQDILAAVRRVLGETD